MQHGNESLITEVASPDFGISDEVTQILKWIIYIGLCMNINIVGIVTNIINIVCFVKQGFHDPVNISLLGLSISDLGSMTTMLCSNIILLTPLIAPAGLPFDPYAICYLVFFIPHLAFSRVTSWITAIITLERCLCIVAPLKVKSIITGRRMEAIIVCLFVVLFLCGAPVYAVNGLKAQFSPETNETIVGLFYMDYREIVDAVIFSVNNFFIPLTAFFIIVICTIALVYELNNITKWRQSTSSVTNTVNTRNQKVAKMVVIIAVLFISCFVPMSVLMLAVTFEPGLSLNGRYVNIAILLGGLVYILESINSTVNIFIYYTMSSKFRITFHAVFGQDNWSSRDGFD